MREQTSTILLSKGLVAVVDTLDYGFLSRFKWSARMCADRNYAITAARTEGKYVATFMHRMIMNAPPHMVVDHINGNPLDNRRSNLRLCTRSENALNRRNNYNREFKGVTEVKRDGQSTGRFIAVVQFQGKKYQAKGSFRTIRDAAAAYDLKAKELFGEFANLNLPEDTTKQLSEAECSNSENGSGR